MISAASSCFLGSRLAAARPAGVRRAVRFLSRRKRIHWAFDFCSRNATTTTLVESATSVFSLSSPHLSLPRASHSPPKISTQAGVVAPRAEIQLPDLPYAIVSFFLHFFWKVSLP